MRSASLLCVVLASLSASSSSSSSTSPFSIAADRDDGTLPCSATAASRLWAGAASLLGGRLSAAAGADGTEAAAATGALSAAASLARLLLLHELPTAEPLAAAAASRRRAAAMEEAPDELDDADIRSLLSGGGGTVAPLTSAQLAPRGRDLAAAPPSQPPCSGVGLLVSVPAAPARPPSGTSYSCNGVGVSQLAFDGITASQAPPPGAPPRPSPAPALLRAAALAAALATTPNITRNGVIDGSALLPPGTDLQRQLLPPQQTAVARGAGVASVAQVATSGQLLSDALLADALNLVLVLSQLGPGTIAALLANTTCAVGPASAASGAGAQYQQVCVCPHDYHGASCEFGLGFQCAALVADPLYHACVAANGAGFSPPQWPADMTGQAPVRPAELSASALAAGRAALGGANKPPSAVAAAVAWLRGTAPALLGLALAEGAPAPGARMPSSPGSSAAAAIAAGSSLGYTPSAAGAPPCLFARRAAPSATLAFRVSCGWQRRNVAWSDALSAGQTLVDPAGAAYALKLPGGGAGPAATLVEQAQDAANLEALEGVLRAAALTSPRNAPFQQPGGGSAAAANSSSTGELNNPPGVVRCNGSATTRAYLDAALSAAGTNRSAAARAGRGAPFFGLVCAEQRFAYLPAAGDALAFDAAEAGPDGASAPALGFAAPFALSRLPAGVPNASSLVLRLRAISSTRYTDGALTTLVSLTTAGGEGLSSLQLPKGVLLGGADVVAPVPLPGAADAAGAWWAGGRLALEARVVMAPLGGSAAVAARALAPLRSAAQAGNGGPVVPSNATLALADALSTALGLAPSASASASAARPRYPPQPLLLLSSLHALALDDAAFAEPAGESVRSRSLRLALSVGLPLAAVTAAISFAVFRWRARHAAGSGAKEE